MKIINSKRKLSFLVLFGAILLTISIFSTVTLYSNQDNVKDINSKPINPFEITNPKTSDYWELTEIVEIDGDGDGIAEYNWTTALLEDWCSGYGNSTDPYIIENVSILVSSASAGLTIKDSDAYFVLNNVTITNDAGDGLELNTISNGIAQECNFNENGNSGIYMNNVNDSAIVFTYCINNTMDGIYVVDSNYNLFMVDCSGNGRYGLILASCSENMIVTSQFIDNVEAGLVIVETPEHQDSVNNTVYVNYFENNGINAVDNSTLPNNWDFEGIGNEWDDYGGVDADDDLIGDTPYDISGTAGSVDNYPYCDDGAESEIITLPSDDDDEAKEVDIFTIITFAVIFIGVFLAGIILTKLITIKPKTKGQRK